MTSLGAPAKRRRRLVSWVAATLVALAVSAATQARAADAPDDRTASAKALWQEANSHYAVGEYNAAAEKYQAAYKLKADAALLYNAAQSYRLGGNNEKALLLYKNYVMFYPNSKNVSNVEQQIVKLQEAIAAQETAKTQPPTTTEPAGGMTGTTTATATPGASAASAEAGAGTMGVPAAPAPTPAPAASLVAAPAPETSSEPIYKKWWLWTAVGAVVVAGVITTVIIASGSSSPWNTAPDLGPGAP